MISQNTNKQGFTLMEIVVVIGILGMVLWLMTLFNLDVVNFGNYLSQSLTAQGELQQTLKVMKIEIRSMGTATTGSYPIESASPNSFVFFSDYDRDGLFERIRYFADGNILKRGSIKPSGVPLSYNPGDEKISGAVHNLAGDLNNIFAFYPHGVDSLPLSQPIEPALIRLVKVKISVDENPNQPPEPAEYSITVNIRVLRSSF